MSEEMKRCQFCGEEVLAVAIKCKHCGSNLSSFAEDFSGAPQPSQGHVDQGLILLAIPSIATLLVWLWVSNMNLLQGPTDTLVLILVGTMISTGGVAALEASKLGMVTDRSKGSNSPTAWFFGFLLLWLVAYPLYLYKRKDYGQKNLAAAGLAITFVFIGSWGFMFSAIEQKKAEIRNSIEQLQNSFENIGKSDW